MKQKLLIVAGAGASIEFGMPSVTEIDLQFEEWSQKIAPIEGSGSNLYKFIKEEAGQYYSNNSRNRKDVLLNFERTLFTIQSLYSIINDKEGLHNHHLGAFVNVSDLPRIIKFRGEAGEIDGFDLHRLYSHLIDQLVELFRNKVSAR